MALLGIEIGGTKLVLTVGDDAGRPRVHMRRPMNPSGNPMTDIDRIIDDARLLLERAGGDHPSVVGVSVPGPLDASTGIVLQPPNLPGWKEVAMKRYLEAAFETEVRLENDANAAALAEWKFGAGRGVRDLAYLTMSTGVGAGLILDGRLYRGAYGGAGEFGHVPVEWPGRTCACGRTGCLEACCGGNAWQARLRLETPESSEVFVRAGSRDEIRPEHVVQAAHAGDAFAREALAEWVDSLGRGLGILAMMLEPQRIVLGTIAVAAGEALCFEPLRKRLAAVVWAHQVGRIEIVPAELGDEMPQYAGLAVALGDDAVSPTATVDS